MPQAHWSSHTDLPYYDPTPAVRYKHDMCPLSFVLPPVLTLT